MAPAMSAPRIASARRAIGQATLDAGPWSVILQGSGLLFLLAIVLTAIAVTRFGYREERCCGWI